MIAQLTQFELGWVVGFLEGEGNVSAARKPNGFYTLGMGAKQVQREPLERLQRLVGGKIYGPYSERDRATPIYQWRISTLRAKMLAQELRPYFSPRRQAQVDAALTKYAVRLTRSEAAARAAPKRIANRMSDPRQLRIV